MEDYKLINVHVFNPAFKNVKARCEYLYCNNSENCKHYRDGKCVTENRMFSFINCPHSRKNIEEGYTQRAKKFYTWQLKREEKYKEVLDVIHTENAKLCICGDYVYLPYAHMRNYVNSLPFIINEYFCKVENFTVETIVQIVKFRPQALLGGEITDFQEESVPKFLQHLKEELPQKYNDFIEAYPELIEKYKEKEDNYIGRKAYITTLKVGSIVRHKKNKFIWDGKNLICENYTSCFLPFNISSSKLLLQPKESDVIEISDNNQVDENTKFSD